VQSLDRALRILDGFQGRQLRVSEIAREQRMSKSTVFRLLGSLRRAGYVRQETDGGRYGLGLHILQLGQHVAAQLDVRRVARPTMQALVERSCGSSFLAVLIDGALINVEQVDSPEPVRLVLDNVRLSRLPHTAGTGKVLMAALAEDERERLFEKLVLTPLTQNTIVDLDELRRELARVREQGFGVNDEEQVLGVRGVAAPIQDRRGAVIAAVSVAASSARLTRDRLPVWAAWVRSAASEISANLGAPAPSRAKLKEESVAL